MAVLNKEKKMRQGDSILLQSNFWKTVGYGQIWEHVCFYINLLLYHTLYSLRKTESYICERIRVKRVNILVYKNNFDLYKLPTTVWDLLDERFNLWLTLDGIYYIDTHNSLDPFLHSCHIYFYPRLGNFAQRLTGLGLHQITNIIILWIDCKNNGWTVF